MTDPLAIRQELRGLVDAYATACDGKDGGAFAALFTHDATLAIYQPFEDQAVATLEGRAAMPAAIAPLSRYRATLHLMANHTATLQDDGEATGETYCLAHHLRATTDAGVEDLVMMIRYGDRYARTGEGWRFARRDVRILWSEVHLATDAPIPL